MSRLRKADLVSSTRGAHGGYELHAIPAEIAMAEVVQRAGGLDGPDAVLRRAAAPACAVQPRDDGYENCATKVLWTRVQGGIARALEQTTLAELGSSPSARPAQPRRRATRRDARRGHHRGRA